MLIGKPGDFSDKLLAEGVRYSSIADKHRKREMTAVRQLHDGDVSEMKRGMRIVPVPQAVMVSHRKR